MAATIEWRGIRATIAGYEWACAIPEMATFLANLLPLDGASGSDPNPDYHAALEAAHYLGGEVIVFDETEYEEGQVY